jgi:hypothetical protein
MAGWTPGRTTKGDLRLFPRERISATPKHWGKRGFHPYWEEGGVAMWKAALMISYGLPIPGREVKALTNFADAQTIFGKLAADGKCAEPEIFHHTDGGGFMLLRAEGPEILHEILEMDEVRHAINTALYTSLDFHHEIMVTGDVLMERMAEYTSIGSELGYM